MNIFIDLELLITECLQLLCLISIQQLIFRHELNLIQDALLHIDREQWLRGHLCSFIGNQLLKDVIQNENIVSYNYNKLTFSQFWCHVHYNFSFVDQSLDVFPLFNLALLVLFVNLFGFLTQVLGRSVEIEEYLNAFSEPISILDQLQDTDGGTYFDTWERCLFNDQIHDFIISAFFSLLDSNNFLFIDILIYYFEIV